MWEQIQANRRRSALLMIGMVFILLMLGYAAGELLTGPGNGLYGLLVAFIIWGLQIVVYWTSSQSILLHGAIARELSREDSPRLFNIVEEMCLASGLGYQPKIYLIDDSAPNAFALGRKPKESAIVLTTGLMYRLRRDELQGVIAHEIGHLKNRDTQFMTLAVVMLGSVAILSEVIWRGLRRSSRSRSSARGGGGRAQLIIFLIAILIAVLAPIMIRLLYFACSRRREYLADASGAQFTRYPEGLASALEKISAAGVHPAFATQTTAPMFIVNPFSATEEGSSLFATHPPAVERIRILRGMGGASFRDYEEAFQRIKSRGVIGAQSLQAEHAQTIREPSSEEEPFESQRAIHNLSYRLHGYLPIQCTCGMKFSVPEGYDEDQIRCIRCGSILPIPTVQATSDHEEKPTPSSQADLPPSEYTRMGHGWESFRCECGRSIHLSPNFIAPNLTCPHCNRIIHVTSNIVESQDH